MGDEGHFAIGHDYTDVSTHNFKQDENTDPETEELIPPGFWLVPLPYVNDIRKLDIKRTVAQPNEQLVELATGIVQALTVPDIDLASKMNPALQKFYTAIEVSALGEKPQEIIDHVKPHVEGMERIAGDLMHAFVEEAYRTESGEHYNPMDAAQLTEAQKRKVYPFCMYSMKQTTFAYIPRIYHCRRTVLLQEDARGRRRAYQMKKMCRTCGIYISKIRYIRKLVLCLGCLIYFYLYKWGEYDGYLYSMIAMFVLYAQISSLTLKDLRDFLEVVGLPKSGTKAAVVERITDYFNKQQP